MGAHAESLLARAADSHAPEAVKDRWQTVRSDGQWSGEGFLFCVAGLDRSPGYATDSPILLQNMRHTKPLANLDAGDRRRFL
jgi:hypothetical protein